MNAYSIYELLQDAYGRSTHTNNRFEKAIKAIDWEDVFQADGEWYFCLDGLTFTTPSLDPFYMPWRPEVLFADGSTIAF